MFVQQSRKVPQDRSASRAQRQPANGPCQLQLEQLSAQLNDSPRMVAQRKSARQLIGATFQREPTQMKKGTPVNDDKGLEQEADVMGAKAASIVPTEGKTSRPASNDSQSAVPLDARQAPAQKAGGDDIVQCTLMPKDSFASQFKDNDERQSKFNEYHAQICSDLDLYHDYEYDLNKNLWNEIDLKFDVRKLALERVILGCNLWMHFPVKKRPTEGNLVPWDTVQNLKSDAVAELNKFYKGGHEGKVALHTDLDMRAGRKKLETYSVDEFKGEADLGVVSSNVGEMGAVVSTLKAFHAIEEVSTDDGTRVAKLKTLDALSQLAKDAIQSLHATQARKSYKEGYPGFWQAWHNSRLQALERLTEMVKNSRERFVDALAWRLNLQNARTRNEEAKEGRGIDMSDAADGWVDVDDGDRSKELEAETNEILRRLGPGPTSD